LGNGFIINVILYSYFILYFKPIISGRDVTIGKYGVGYKPPSYHDIREKLLKQGVSKTNLMLEEYKEEWKRIGCTIMSYCWTGKKDVIYATYW